MPIASLADGVALGAAYSSYDLLIVGSGPVGLAIANECARSATRVIVVESGRLVKDSSTDDLDEFESVGERRMANRDVIRTRAFGGTSNVWSGRCTPFDDIDFEARSWVPFSGWPFDATELGPYIDRAASYLGLELHHYDERLWHELGGKPFAGFDPATLRSQFWQYSTDSINPRDFARAGPQFIRRSIANVDVLLGATVTRLNFGPSGRAFASVEVASPDGARHMIRARRAVLCAGGIENARLLLSSWRESPAGLAESRALTGRFLMDHPRCTMGTFDARDAEAINRVFGLYRLRRPGRSRAFTHGVALSPSLQRQESLLNCAAWLTEARCPDDPWDALKRLTMGPERQSRDVAAVLANLPFAARGVKRYFTQGRGVLHKCEAVFLDCLVEQVPDPSSRLTLSKRTDRFGVPLAQLDWKINDLEKRTLSHFGEVILTELARLGLPLPRLADWIKDKDFSRAELRDAAHPIGTTRISKDPRHGVVDERCQVHGVDGLYVAGSSVFPTGGHANPTLMALALALRLADHLTESGVEAHRENESIN